MIRTTLLLAACAAAQAQELPRVLFEDARSILTAPVRWDGDDWTRAALGAGAVLATGLLLDRPLDDGLQRGRTPALDRDARFLQRFGGEYSFVVIGGLFIAPETRPAATDALAASLITGLVITPALKAAVGRDRPNAEAGTHSFRPFSSRESFPSGHTTQAFAVASAIAAHGGTWTAVAAYGLAGLVGLSRLEQHDHFASDVLAGALIGTLTGRAVASFNDLHGRGWSARFNPDLRPGYQGVILEARF